MQIPTNLRKKLGKNLQIKIANEYTTLLKLPLVTVIMKFANIIVFFILQRLSKRKKSSPKEINIFSRMT